MKIVWLGQAGLLFVHEKDGMTVMIDPYLSNSVVKYEPQNDRRVPVNEAFLELVPDVMIFTHDHLDHYDPETVDVFLAKAQKPILFLAPSSVYEKLKGYGQKHRVVLFDAFTEWTEEGIRFRAIRAVHSDAHAIGVVVEDIENQKTYYIAGDTLYSSKIFEDLPETIDIAFLPINGVGNNMNVCDAKRFFAACRAKTAIPYHYGMFDEIDPASFDTPNKILLKEYVEKEI